MKELCGWANEGKNASFLIFDLLLCLMDGDGRRRVEVPTPRDELN
jgi:hypothetical protein